MAVDSCSMHKLGLIGGEISLTLTVAAAADELPLPATWNDIVVIFDSSEQTLWALIIWRNVARRNRRTMNTYVSCRSSLHGNPQHYNTCLLRSSPLKWAVSMETRQPPLMMALMKWHPLIAPAPPSLRDGGWMGGWVGGRVVVEVAEKNITDKEKDSHFPQKLNHVTASFFPAGVVYLAPKAGSDRNIVNQMRRSRNGSQPHRPGWHASHLSRWFMCHEKSVIEFFCVPWLHK